MYGTVGLLAISLLRRGFSAKPNSKKRLSPCALGLLYRADYAVRWRNSEKKWIGRRKTSLPNLAMVNDLEESIAALHMCLQQVPWGTLKKRA